MTDAEKVKAREQGQKDFNSNYKVNESIPYNYSVAYGAIQAYMSLVEDGVFTEAQAKEHVFGIFDAMIDKMGM